ncbi:MAG: RdgB/HAM1 family non-canonical purine NTP pyrophosphatase [Bacteroidia bacterium]|nr:RdgB/HAM1 family non-canonical purine NTP pyrophosphatase [Bacteroidia bacterium]
MSAKLIFATSNTKKLEEVRHHLSEKYTVLSLADVGFTGEIEETGKTFRENAALKANFVSEKYGLDCFADDSGLEVDALGGAPGVYSARFAGEPKNDRANNDLLLAKLNGIKNRKASFITVIALKIGSEIFYFEGRVEGLISETFSGNNGFGYDPLFLPRGFTKSFAQMNLDEKNKISHRAIAVNKLVDFLKNKEAF